MHYGLKTHEITITTSDGQHTVKGIVTANTTSDDTSTFDNMTEVDSLTIHVTTPTRHRKSTAENSNTTATPTTSPQPNRR